MGGTWCEWGPDSPLKLEASSFRWVEEAEGSYGSWANMKLEEQGRNGHVTPESPAYPWMLPGCEKEMTILANNVSVGGRATSRCGKRPCTWAAQKTSWAWHQMRCCQASETSGQSRGAVVPGQPWLGSTSTGSDNSIWGPKTSRTTSPVRRKYTAIPHHQGLCAFLSRRRLGEEGESATTFPWAFPLSLPSVMVSVFFFFFFFFFWPLFPSLLVWSLPGPEPTHIQTPWWHLICLVSSSQPLLFLGHWSSFLNLLRVTAGPEC